MVTGILGKFNALRIVFFSAFSSRNEIELMKKCIQEIERKRKRALERAEKRNKIIDKYGAPVISDWEKDDRYADDKFYNKKVEECYNKSRPVKRAMGLP